jgi:hypothetical protein
VVVVGVFEPREVKHEVSSHHVSLELGLAAGAHERFAAAAVHARPVAGRDAIRVARRR